KSRGIVVVYGGRGRTGAVQGHGVEGGEPVGGAPRGPAVQPHLTAAGADRCRAKARRARGAAIVRWGGRGERGAGAIGDAARAGAARGPHDLWREVSGAVAAGISEPVSRSFDRSSLERCDRRSHRGGL